MGWIARHGRYFLIGGLIAGTALPGLGRTLAPVVPLLIAALLFLNAFRSGPALLGGLKTSGWGTLRLVLALQLALPLATLALVTLFGFSASALGVAVVLMLASPALSGTPNLVAMSGDDPARGMRVLVVGVMVAPLTVLPILWLMPQIGAGEAMQAALRLLITILAIGVVGILARRALSRHQSEARMNDVSDAASAVLLAVIVIGLMAEVGPRLVSDPLSLALWLAAAFALNIGLQFTSFRVLAPDPDAVAGAIAAGNRNLALYLIALPEPIIAQIMLFIGCYQFPMYLTPMMLGWLYRRG